MTERPEPTAAPETRGSLLNPFAAHPDGLPTLFFMEFWERFSYYGMRALLVLFMAAGLANGGLGFDDKTAGAIYGLYTASVYLLALPGGWIADRLLGAQGAVWYGGIVIAIGHFVLAVPTTEAFFLGLMFVALGTGMLKPNVSAVVGELYEEGDPRRDGGFTIFYMGINLGAIFGPLLCGWLAEESGLGWHAGFAAAGVGMVLGLLQFRRMKGLLGSAGQHPTADVHTPDGRAKARQLWTTVAIAMGVVALVAGAMMLRLFTVDVVSLAEGTAYLIASIGVLYFGWLLAFGKLTRVERNRVFVIIVLFLGAATFWSGFEQAGSSLNLFAERYTDRTLGGFTIPATWFQSLNPIFIVVLAPAFAQMWAWLARRNLEPTTPTKFALGLIGLGLGFVVMIGGAAVAASGQKALPTWLFFTYLVHTLGELALSPVGLSATTKLAPRRYVGQMMGVWFLGASLGSVLAGLIAGEISDVGLEQMPALYGRIFVSTAGAGLLLLVLTKPVQRLMGGLR